MNVQHQQANRVLQAFAQLTLHVRHYFRQQLCLTLFPTLWNGRHLVVELGQSESHAAALGDLEALVRLIEYTSMDNVSEYFIEQCPCTHSLLPLRRKEESTMQSFPERLQREHGCPFAASHLCCAQQAISN